MGKKIRDSVVVITGASSGIGRAAALRFAEKGPAKLVLAARREQALRELAKECQQMGAETLVVPTDVRNEAAVGNLAREAMTAFGRIDAWVNNAAITMFARFEEAPPDVFRQVVETNLFGYVFGARAAIPIFREQGRGVLINVSSVVGVAAIPYISAYEMTKAAIISLSQCLREEVSDADIAVCTILPASIDTPLFQQAANFTGRAVKPLDPVYDANKVAKAIVGCVTRPRREVTVGRSGSVFKVLRLFPPLYERLIPGAVDRGHFHDAPAPPTSGNVFAAMPEFATVSGGWRRPMGIGARTASLALPAAAAASVAAAAVWMQTRRRETARPRVLRQLRERMGR